MQWILQGGAGFASFFALTSVFASAQAEEARQMTMAGLEPVKIGMTVPEAETALGAKLEPRNAAFGEDCWSTRRADGADSFVTYMVQNGAITRLDIVTRPNQTEPTIKTNTGIGIGTSETAIKAAYGDKLDISPHPYRQESGHYVLVNNADHKSGILFETEQGKVTGFRVGRHPALDFVEGCV